MSGAFISLTIRMRTGSPLRLIDLVGARARRRGKATTSPALELALALGRAQARRAGDHDQHLLVAEVVVVGEGGLARARARTGSPRGARRRPGGRAARGGRRTPSRSDSVVEARARRCSATLIAPGTRACASRGTPACPRPGPRSPSPARRAAAPARARRRATSPRRRARPAWRAGRRSAGARRSAARARAPPRATRASSATALTIPMPLGLGGVEAPAGEHQLHRPLLADRARQPLGAAAAGDDPERDLGLAELGRLGGDDQVADQRQLAAAAERPARDRGDHRRPALGEPAPERRRRVKDAPRGTRARRARRCRRRRRTPRRSRRSRCSAPRGRRRSASTAAASSSISSGESALRASGRLSRQSATWPSIEVSTSSSARGSCRGGTIALIPVASRPMISFWICEVPS